MKTLTPDAVQAVHRARPDDRAVAWQADGRLGRDRRRHVAADDDRAALAARRVPRAARGVTSPDPVASQRLYLDMKYDDDTLLGLNWAGNVSVRQAYDWDPSAASGASADNDPRHRGAALVRDAGEHARRRVHGVPASGGGRRSGVGPGCPSRLDGVPVATRGAIAALDGAGRQLPPRAGDCLAVGGRRVRLTLRREDILTQRPQRVRRAQQDRAASGARRGPQGHRRASAARRMP